MQCYHPLRAWRRGAAPPVFSMPAGSGYRVLELPCGQCVGCRLERSREWAIRCVHESKMHEQNCMLTLTYDEAHLPADLSLRHRDFQLFLKRLRESAPKRLRYFMCGEYGEKTKRPHYHALLFGHSPADQRYFRTSDAGFKCYTSKSLEAVWQKGAVYVGELSFDSAAYIARYALKALVDIDVNSGETVKKPYIRMSLKPGIGGEFWAKYGKTDVFAHDRIVLQGKFNRVPRYYDKLMEKISPLFLAEVKAKRVDAGRERAARLLESLEKREYFTDEQRLKVHEVVKLASLRLLKRE